MELQDQWLSREEAMAQRDFYLTAASNWASHRLLALSAGNGGGLLALGAIVAGKHLFLFELLVAAIAALSFILGVIAASAALATAHQQAVKKSLAYNQIVLQHDFRTHFLPHVDQATASQHLGGMTSNMMAGFNAADSDDDQLNRTVLIGTWSFGVGLIMTMIVIALVVISADPS